MTGDRNRTVVCFYTECIIKTELKSLQRNPLPNQTLGKCVSLWKSASVLCYNMLSPPKKWYPINKMLNKILSPAFFNILLYLCCLIVTSRRGSRFFKTFMRTNVSTETHRGLRIHVLSVQVLLSKSELIICWFRGMAGLSCGSSYATAALVYSPSWLLANWITSFQPWHLEVSKEQKNTSWETLVREVVKESHLMWVRCVRANANETELNWVEEQHFLTTVQGRGGVCTWPQAFVMRLQLDGFIRLVDEANGFSVLDMDGII